MSLITPHERRVRRNIIQDGFNGRSFTGESGKREILKLDLDRLMQDPTFSYSVGELLFSLYTTILEHDPGPFEGIGGPGQGGELMVQSLNAALKRRGGEELATFNVPVDATTGKIGTQLKGFIKPGAKVILLDDVLRRGGSILRALKGVKEAGMKAPYFMCLIWCFHSGTYALRRHGLTPHALLGMGDVLNSSNTQSWHAFYGTAAPRGKNR